MDLPDSLTEKQRARVEAYFNCDCSDTKAAKHLGISLTSLRKSLWLSLKKGVQFTPDKFSKAAPVGWECSFSTVQHRDGDIVQQWDRIKPVNYSTEDLIEYFNSRIKPSVSIVKKPKEVDEDSMLLVPIYDAHHGMLSWANETGSNYDTKISSHLQKSSSKIIFSSTGYVKKTTVVLGGDNQTFDNMNGTTEASGNIIDRDGRFQKAALCSVDSATVTIDIAREHSETVHVVVLPGNHDETSALWLSIVLNAHYRFCDDVTIDMSAGKHRFFSWGINVFMGSHGEIKDKAAADTAINQSIRRGYAKDPDIRIRVLLGHLHKEGKKTPNPDELSTIGGVIVERFPTLAAPEAYVVKNGWVSVRATNSALYHKKYGWVGGRQVILGEIFDKYPMEG